MEVEGDCGSLHRQEVAGNRGADAIELVDRFQEGEERGRLEAAAKDELEEDLPRHREAGRGAHWPSQNGRVY